MNELKEGIHYYFSEEGLLVFTEQYLREKGYCCGNGCRHCPFELEDNPEPGEKELKTENSVHK